MRRNVRDAPFDSDPPLVHRISSTLQQPKGKRRETAGKKKIRQKPRVCNLWSQNEQMKNVKEGSVLKHKILFQWKEENNPVISEDSRTGTGDVWIWLQWKMWRVDQWKQQLSLSSLLPPPPRPSRAHPHSSVGAVGAGAAAGRRAAGCPGCRPDAPGARASPGHPSPQSSSGFVTYASGFCRHNKVRVRSHSTHSDSPHTHFVCRTRNANIKILYEVGK